MNPFYLCPRALILAGLLTASTFAGAVELAAYRFSNNLQSSDTDTESVASTFALRVSGPFTGDLRFVTVDGNRAARVTSVGISTFPGSPFENARTRNLYSSFTITPAQDQALNLSSLDFRISSNSIAAAAGNPNTAGYAVFSSIDNYTDALLGPSDAPGSLIDAPTIDLSGADFQILTVPVSFRIYHWNSTNLATGALLDDVVLRGTTASVAVVPEPSTYAMLLAGLGVLALRKRRRGQAA